MSTAFRLRSPSCATGSPGAPHRSARARASGPASPAAEAVPRCHRRRGTPWLALAAILLVPGAALAQAVPVSELMAQALEGPAMEAARARLAGAAAGTKSARSGLRPQVGIEARAWQLGRTPGFIMPPLTLGPFETPSLGVPIAERRAERVGIALDQLLWDGGRSIRELRAARRFEEGASLAREATRLTVEYQVVQAAAAWERALAERTTARASIEQRQALVEQVQAFVEQELVPKADLLQARAALAMARHRLAGAGAALEQARARIEALTGRPLPAGAFPAWPDLPGLPSGDPAALAAGAASARPLPRALAAQAEGAGLGADAARRAARPSLHLQVRAERHDDALELNPNNAELALLARWPLATGGRIAAAAARGRAARDGLAAEAEGARRRVVAEARSALAADAAATPQLTAATAAHEAAAEALRVARARYREGLISGRELLEAERDATAARELFEVARATRVAIRIGARLALGLDPFSAAKTTEVSR